MHLLGAHCQRNKALMSTIADLATDERTARILLSLLGEPDNVFTARLVRGVGAVETVRLVTSGEAAPKMERMDIRMWRGHIHTESSPKDLVSRLRPFERNGAVTLIPGDKDWPHGLNDLGDHTPARAVGTRGDLAAERSALRKSHDHRGPCLNFLR